MLELTDNPDIELEDMIMARNIAEALHKQYPGHLWAVTCEGANGIATVRNLRLSGIYGFVLKINDLKGHSALVRNALQAGGELLERYRMARGRFNQDEYDQLSTDHAGHFIADK